MDRLVNFEKFKDYSSLKKRLNQDFTKKVLGGDYYIPYTVTTQLMVYNKQLFKEAGLDPNKPPVTFDEFLKYAKKISDLPKRKNGAKVYGTVFWNDALSWGGWYWSMLAPPYFNMNGGKYQLLNKQGTTIAFDPPQAKMAEYLEFMKNAQKYAPLEMGQNMEKTFFSRTVGMWMQFEYGWAANFKTAAGYPMKIGKDVAVAPIPVPKKGDPSFSTLGGRALMIFRSNLKREKLAWEFIKFLMLDDNVLAACKELRQLPTVTAIENNSYFKSSATRPFMEQLKHSLMPEDAPESDQIQVLVQQMYAKTVVLNEMSIKNALKETAEKSIAIFKKNQL
jgi:multiple sugar transport system substrate-binding protein